MAMVEARILTSSFRRREVYWHEKSYLEIYQHRSCLLSGGPKDSATYVFPSLSSREVLAIGVVESQGEPGFAVSWMKSSHLTREGPSLAVVFVSLSRKKQNDENSAFFTAQEPGVGQVEGHHPKGQTSKHDAHASAN